MTPKEKAEEIVEKYRQVFRYVNRKAMMFESKQCAIICVEEILNTCPQKENEVFGVSKGIEYWIKVLKEIKEL